MQQSELVVWEDIDGTDNVNFRAVARRGEIVFQKAGSDGRWTAYAPSEKLLAKVARRLFPMLVIECQPASKPESFRRKRTKTAANPDAGSWGWIVKAVIVMAADAFDDSEIFERLREFVSRADVAEIRAHYEDRIRLLRTFTEKDLAQQYVNAIAYAANMKKTGAMLAVGTLAEKRAEYVPRARRGRRRKVDS